MICVSTNSNKCIGCYHCVHEMPMIFVVDKKRSKARLKQKGKLVDLLPMDLSPKQLKEIKEIIKGCPAQAITITK
jgi:ferredoxin